MKAANRYRLYLTRLLQSMATATQEEIDEILEAMDACWYLLSEEEMVAIEKEFRGIAVRPYRED